MATNERDIQDVINTLIAEGVGEGPEGMRRIAETIINRAEQRGISPAEVVRQANQYTGYSSPGPGAIRAQRDPASISAAQAAWQLAQGPDDPTNGANHYWNPNIVSPSWAGGMTQLGAYGNHAFASDRPIPPRDIPNTVGTQLSVIPPRVAPTPASVEDRVTARNTAPPPVSPLQSALNQYAIREGNRVTPAPVEDRVTARNVATARNDAINDAARRASLTSTQSYVGQDRSPTRSMFGNDPMTTSNGPVVATIPSTTRQPTPMSKAPISYAGQERGIPTVPSRAPGTGLTPSPSAAQNIANARSEQAIQRSVGRAPIIPDRLPSSPAGLPALYGTITPQQVSQIGVPSLAPPAITPMRTAPATLPRIPAPQAIASAPRIAPTPFQRPQAFGPPVVAPRAPQNPLTIRVIGSNTIPYPQQPMNIAPTPVPKPIGITNQQRLNNARDAVSQSGDNSVGNQRDAAEARSSGAGGRTRRY